MDQQTTLKSRISYARICVEIAAHQQLLDHIQICLNDNQEHTIRLEYDWKPTRCSHCCIFGHSTTNCPNAPQPQLKTWVPVNTTTNAKTDSANQPQMKAGNSTSKENTTAQNEVSATSEEIPRVSKSDAINQGTTNNSPTHSVPKDKGKRVMEVKNNQITTNNSFHCLGEQLDGDHIPPEGSAPSKGPLLGPSTLSPHV